MYRIALPVISKQISKKEKTMEYIRFGNTGMKVSKLCLGTMTYGGPTERWPWALDEAQERLVISGLPACIAGSWKGIVHG